MIDLLGDFGINGANGGWGGLGGVGAVLERCQPKCYDHDLEGISLTTSVVCSVKLLFSAVAKNAPTSDAKFLCAKAVLEMATL